MEKHQLSSPKGPEAKKVKMSANSSASDGEDYFLAAVEATEPTTLEKKQRYRRRKVALFFAYGGVGYQGMQKNPGAKTIEGDLEEALYRSGAIPEADRGNPKRFDWARSARTDKGVSAVGQVVSGRFYIDPPGLVDRLNATLPTQIRIFGYKRATASFNAKKFCDRRRYVYLIPVFALDPSSHPNRESVLASLGSENELSKCLECSERGRKVVGVMGKHVFENVTTGSDISSNTGVARLLDPEVEPNCTAEERKELLGSTELEKSTMAEKGFHYGKEERERFNGILRHYVGTHNFHNFTTRTKAEDPAARRFILSFEAASTVSVEGIEFVKCEVLGQSFMLHQIRKMMGLAVAVMRNCAPESLLETALQKDVSINVPTAPEVGLYLDECLFTSYNNKWTESHEEVSMKAYREEAEEFKMKHIYPHIASTEHKEGVVALWLHSLNCRNYPDLRVADGGRVASEVGNGVTECERRFESGNNAGD